MTNTCKIGGFIYTDYKAHGNVFLTARDRRDNAITFIRGLPGSGKTTLADKLAKEFNFTVVEANQYFKQDGGEFDFHVDLLPEAHAWAVAKMQSLVADGKGVVVSNTFKSDWELIQYVSALPKGTPYNLVTLHGQFGNNRGIPDDVIAAQQEVMLSHNDALAALEEAGIGVPKSCAINRM